MTQREFDAKMREMKDVRRKALEPLLVEIDNSNVHTAKLWTEIAQLKADIERENMYRKELQARCNEMRREYDDNIYQFINENPVDSAEEEGIV